MEELIRRTDASSQKLYRKSAISSFRGVHIIPIVQRSLFSAKVDFQRVVGVKPPRGITFGKPIRSGSEVLFNEVVKKSEAEYYVNVSEAGTITYREMLWRSEEFDVCMRRSTIVAALVLEYASRLYLEFGYNDELLIRMMLYNVRGKKIWNYPGYPLNGEYVIRDKDDVAVERKIRTADLSGNLVEILEPLVKDMSSLYKLPATDATIKKFVTDKLREAFPTR